MSEPSAQTSVCCSEQQLGRTGKRTYRKTKQTSRTYQGSFGYGWVTVEDLEPWMSVLGDLMTL